MQRSFLIGGVGTRLNNYNQLAVSISEKNAIGQLNGLTGIRIFVKNVLNGWCQSTCNGCVHWLVSEHL